MIIKWYHTKIDNEEIMAVELENTVIADITMTV